MSRYTRPKGRVNRALGMVIYENAGAVRAFERREHPPGMHGQRRGKLSEYGVAMREKKKIKHFYGLHERQLRRFFELAAKSPENTGKLLLVLCERRLDNVIRRAGFAVTRPQARQGIAHGHFRVNGIKVDIPSFLVKPGDTIAVAPRSHVQAIYRPLLHLSRSVVPDWLVLDAGSLVFQVVRLPDAGDVGLTVDVNRVVELLTR